MDEQFERLWSSPGTANLLCTADRLIASGDAISKDGRDAVKDVIEHMAKMAFVAGKLAGIEEARLIVQPEGRP